MAKRNNILKALHDADDRHYRNTEKYVKMVQKLYMQAVSELGSLASVIGLPKDGETFTFSKNKSVMSKVQETLQRLTSRITSVVETGSRKEWTAACVKGEEFVKNIVKTSNLTEQTVKSYQDRNIEALNAFQERKVNGMNLSERVWMTVSQLKSETELAVDTFGGRKFHPAIDSSRSKTKMERGIGEGTSAAELSRDIRSCLKEPDKLFRRVRDKYGNLHLSKAAELYHPGQGVYRSSFKNAMRVTRSEINMAYRQSDQMQWAQDPLVVGIKIELSNNHTCLGRDGKPHPFHDICDDLQGEYPKTFRFVGWHPQCRCHITPIQIPLDEITNIKVNPDGSYEQMPASNEVKDVPDNFKKYVQEHYDQIEGRNGWNGWKSKPYYWTENAQFVDKAVNADAYAPVPLSLTPDEMKLLSEFEMYAVNHQGSKKFALALEDAKKAVLNADRETFDAAMNAMDLIRRKNEASVASKARKRMEEDEFARLIESRRKQFEQLKEDPDYEDVEFDPATGGLKATHKDHNFDKDKGHYEKDVRDAGFAAGHSVILESEKFQEVGERFTEGSWDGSKFELMGCETATKNNYLRGLKHANSKPDAKVAVLSFPNGGFDEDMVIEAVKRYQGLVNKDPENFRELERIVCIQDGKVVFDRPYKTVREAPVTRSTPRSAKVQTNTESQQDTEVNNGNEAQKQAQKPTAVAKKPKIDPMKERHIYDDRIRTLRDWSKAYRLDMTAIDDAYGRGALDDLKKAVLEQEKILMDRKQEVYRALDELRGLGGDADRFIVNERNSYITLLELIREDIERIKAFNAFFLSQKQRYDLVLIEAKVWDIPQGFIDAIEDAVNRRDKRDLSGYLDLIENKIKGEKEVFEEYRRNAQKAIKEAEELNVNNSSVKSDLESVGNNNALWKFGKDMYYGHLNNLNDAIAEARRKAGADNPHSAMKTEYKTASDISETINQINKGLTGHPWLLHGDMSLDKESNLHNNGSTDMSGHIWLQQNRIDLCRSAMAKIGNSQSKDITFEEADAMATLWHEINHNRNRQGSMGYQSSRKEVTRLMELANEFVSRKTLGEFYSTMGAVKLPHPEFVTERRSTGYNRWVKNYDYIIDRLGLDRDKVTATVINTARETEYDKQKNGLVQALIDGGLTRLDKKKLKVNDVKAIVSYCLDCFSPSDMDKILEMRGFLLIDPDEPEPL